MTLPRVALTIVAGIIAGAVLFKLLGRRATAIERDPQRLRYIAPDIIAGGLKRVDDRTGLLDPGELPHLEMFLQQIRDGCGVDIRFLLVDSVPGTLQDSALHYARALGIGRDIDRRGVLIAYDVRRQDLRVEVGPTLEPIFTDRFVGYLLRNHLRNYFAAGNPTFGFRIMLFMLQNHLRRAALGEEYNPQVVEFIQARDRLALGGGASARMPNRGEPGSFPIAEPDSAEAAYFGAQPTIEAAFSRYMEWLRWERNLPGVMLFAPGSQGYLAELNLPFHEYILFLEYGQPHAVLERGDLGMLYFTKDPLSSPHLLRRTPAGWQIDFVAEVLNTEELAGGVYAWRYRGRGDDFSQTFADQLVQVSPEIVRLRHGDNRPLRALRPWFD